MKKEKEEGWDRRDGREKREKIEINLAKDHLATLCNSLGKMEAGRRAKRFQ